MPTTVRRDRVCVCALASCVLIGAGGRSALGDVVLGHTQSVSLGTVLSDPQRAMIIGQLRFVFDANVTSVNVASGGVTLTGHVPTVNPELDTGFNILGVFAVGQGGPVYSESLLRFTVEPVAAALAQGQRITGNRLVFNGSSNGAGTYARIDQANYNPLALPGQDLIETDSVYSFWAGPPAGPNVRLEDPDPMNALQESPLFGQPYQKLDVISQLSFFGGTTGFGGMSFARYTFSHAVPAPGVSMMLGVAAVCAGGRRSRRK